MLLQNSFLKFLLSFFLSLHLVLNKYIFSFFFFNFPMPCSTIYLVKFWCVRMVLFFLNRGCGRRVRPHRLGSGGRRGAVGLEALRGAGRVEGRELVIRRRRCGRRRCGDGEAVRFLNWCWCRLGRGRLLLCFCPAEVINSPVLVEECLNLR